MVGLTVPLSVVVCFPRGEANSLVEKMSTSERLNPNNPVVFFDVTVGSTEIGRIKFELFADVVPKTAENFRQLCTGEYKKDGVPIGFKKCTFHRVIKDFMVQGGDFVNNDGTGLTSVYGGAFADENFKMKHSGPGILSMLSAIQCEKILFQALEFITSITSYAQHTIIFQANSGKDTNGCQFFITCAKCDFLDGKHVVFGRVVDGLLVLRKIENIPTGPNNKPKIPVIISQCGEM